MTTDIILNQATELLKESRRTWESYNPGRINKLCSVIEALSISRGSPLRIDLSSDGFRKIYRTVNTFESHVFYLLFELLGNIKLIPDRVYQKKIIPVRLYLNLLTIVRDRRRVISDIPDEVPLMMYWDRYNKRLWRVVASDTLDSFKIQTLIENDRDMEDAILNLQNNRLFFGEAIPLKIRMNRCAQDIEYLNKGYKNTHFYKVTY